ncbi:MAG: nucleoside 2-deoxyribosyltransferase domain-containing protein [Bryobacteraceae bacterium]
MAEQVFLGGACGRSTWRRDIAIPALERAGVSYFDPQLGVGEWNEACQAEEMRAKAEAEVLLFVINGETRGVATVGEASYYLGAGRPLALAVTDVTNPELTQAERDDLNRGRIFVRSMAAEHGVPVFADVAAAVDYAIALVKRATQPLDAGALRSILDSVRFEHARFLMEEAPGGFLVQICMETEDAASGERRVYHGRKWYVDAAAGRSAAVRTVFMAALAWQEHEAREMFRFEGTPLFHPHHDADALVRFTRTSKR